MHGGGNFNRHGGTKGSFDRGPGDKSPGYYHIAPAGLGGIGGGVAVGNKCPIHHSYRAGYSSSIRSFGASFGQERGIFQADIH